MLSARLLDEIDEAMTELILETSAEIETLETITPNAAIVRRLSYLRKKLDKLRDAASRFADRHHTYFWGHPSGCPSSLRGNWGAYRGIM